jgi:hypothetical protein
VGGKCVVDGDGDTTGSQGPSLHQLADVGLKGEVAPLVLCHMDPIHPLQIQDDGRTGQQARSEEGKPCQLPPATLA